MTTRADLEARTRRLMVEQWGVTIDQLKEETKLGGELGVDSLDIIELVMKIEDEFCVAIPDDVIDGRVCDQTVGDVFDAVSRYVVTQAA